MVLTNEQNGSSSTNFETKEDGFIAFLPSHGDGAEGGIDPPSASPEYGPAPESALGLRPRMALSSAQVARSVSNPGYSGTPAGAVGKEKH